MEIDAVCNVIALSLVKGIGSSFMKKNRTIIKNYCQSGDLLVSLTKNISQQDFQNHFYRAKSIVEDCEKINVKIVTIIDANYPVSLFEIKDPPPILYLQGNLSLLSKSIAIIGTRHSTELGNRIAIKIGSYFSKEWAVCNGLVDGIDKHTILNNGEVLPNVVGVLSGGLNFSTTSSKITRELAEKVIGNSGLLVSESEPSKKEDQFSGSKASRIQAGLSKGLILIQSKIDGGSKYTIKSFSELTRPIGVVEVNSQDEYLNHDSFGANRFLLKNQRSAIIEMCDIKNLSSINTTKIVRIAGKEDYVAFERELDISII
jgi:DNA processing protein